MALPPEAVGFGSHSFSRRIYTVAASYKQRATLFLPFCTQKYCVNIYASVVVVGSLKEYLGLATQTKEAVV